MKIVDGIKIYENGENIPELEGVEPPGEGVEAPWGWRIVDQDGHRRVIPGTKESLHSDLAATRGLPLAELDLNEDQWCNHIPVSWHPFNCSDGECREGYSCKPHLLAGGGFYCNCDGDD